MTVYRFSNYAAAQRWVYNQQYLVPVLLGDDMRYWVPATPRIARQLLAAGYDQA